MRKAIPFSLLLALLGLLVLQVGCGSDEENPVTPAPKCSFEVTSPTPGQQLATDQTISVRWKRGTTENVMIQLYKGANAVGTIKADHTNTGTDGFYPWLKPETFGQGSGDDYSIRVSSIQNPDCFDRSGQFTITDASNCSVEFVWTSKDSLIAGQDLDIRWNSESTTGFVTIELWYYPFSSPLEMVGVVAERIPDTGSYIWPVRSFNRGTDEGYRLRIKDYDYGDCTDITEPFKISDENVCSIAVLGISDGQTYVQGSTLPISFDMENSSFVVKLKLFSGNEQVNVPPMNGVIIDSFDTVNGTAFFNWVVSDMDHGGPAFNRFNIRAYDVDDEYCVGRSVDFAISQ